MNSNTGRSLQSGWLRFGWLLTVLYAAFFTAYVYYDFTRTKVQTLDGAASSQDAGPWQVIGITSTYTSCDYHAPTASCRVLFKPFLTYLLLPPALAWVVALGAGLAYQRGRAGFTTRKASANQFGNSAAGLGRNNSVWAGEGRRPVRPPPSTVPENVSGNYLLRHWRGECSLGIAYWLNGTLIAGVLTGVLLGVLSGYSDGNQSLRNTAAADILTIVLSLLVWIWSTVGVWRSAERHVSRGGRSFWAAAAKFMVVISVMGMVGKFPVSIAPKLRELALITSGHDPIGKLDVKVSSDGRSVIVVGTFREGSAERVKQILDAAPAVTFLTLDSNGGRLLEAQQLGREVRRRGLGTYVEDQCVSACTYVFLAGKDRAATPNAKIGFHQPSFPGNDVNDQRAATAEMLDDYRRAGLPEAFVQRIGRTLPEAMWFPTRDELILANVITRTSLGGESASSGLWLKSKAEMELVFRESSNWQDIEKRFPGSIQEAVDRAWAAREQGGTDAEIKDAARSVVSALFPKLLRGAPDEFLDTYVALFIDQMQAARNVSPEACLRLLNSQLDLSQVLPNNLGEREAALLKTALSLPSNADAHPPSPQQVKRSMRVAMSRMPEKYVRVVANQSAYANQPAMMCDSMISLYETVQSLPPPDHSVLLYTLFRGGGEQ